MLKRIEFLAILFSILFSTSTLSRDIFFDGVIDDTIGDDHRRYMPRRPVLSDAWDLFHIDSFRTSSNITRFKKVVIDAADEVAKGIMLGTNSDAGVVFKKVVVYCKEAPSVPCARYGHAVADYHDSVIKLFSKNKAISYIEIHSRANNLLVIPAPTVNVYLIQEDTTSAFHPDFFELNKR